MKKVRIKNVVLVFVAIVLLSGCQLRGVDAQSKGKSLQIKIDPADGSYTIGVPGSSLAVLKAGIAVQLDGRWLRSEDYRSHTLTTSKVSDDLGVANEWKVAFSGLAGEPNLSYRLRAYPDKPFADIQVFVHNPANNSFHVESIRPIAALGDSILDLGGPAKEDRVLSDSFGEYRMNFSIPDLADAKNHLHRGFGSQLIYNRQSHRSFFAGALTSERFVTVLRVHVAKDARQSNISAYEVDSTGITDDQKDYPQEIPSGNRTTLNLQLDPGTELRSERLLLGVGSDYHRQLETYGSLIRELHHARTTAPTPMGWWSWTAYYYGLNEGTALTNARWLAQNLKPLGYNFFHIDEGYQYARGEYATPNATLFPNGMNGLEWKIRGLGLVPGIWTAPFEVSNRSWVYLRHPDWLVHNNDATPVRLGTVEDTSDHLFALDCTNPGAQDYLRKTYSTLVNEWGIRFIKLDFMDDSAVEGEHYRPNTTAMEAQRIGLEIIRQTVGDDVLLDKDESPTLNAVGYVDFGRISQDTGHTFDSSKEAEFQIAARYYMNRNFFVADPDAFTVSKQFVITQDWHGGTRPLTLDEAEVSIAVSAISGGMFEIGDDLPILGSEPKRLALVKNQDLIDMARLGRSSYPVDLMTYLREDEQPSIFLLKEDARQSVLSIFNWTNHSRSRTISLSSLGLSGKGPYTADDILNKTQVPIEPLNSILVSQPAHSVRMLKITDTAIAAKAPSVYAPHPSSAQAGKLIDLTAHLTNPEIPAIFYRWNFGDGVTQEGSRVRHAYTHAGVYKLKLDAVGLDGRTGSYNFDLPVTGSIPTQFVPAENTRYRAPQ